MKQFALLFLLVTSFSLSAQITYEKGDEVFSIDTTNIYGSDSWREVVVRDKFSTITFISTITGKPQTFDVISKIKDTGKERIYDITYGSTQWFLTVYVFNDQDMELNLLHKSTSKLFAKLYVKKRTIKP